MWIKRKLYIVLLSVLFLFYCSEPAFCLDEAVVKQELTTLFDLQNKKENLHKDFQSIYQEWKTTIDSLENTLSKSKATINRAKKTIENLELKMNALKKDLITLQNLIDSQEKVLKDLQKNSMVNNLLWLGGGILAGGVLGYFIFK